jgi:hypothetical protein
MESSSAGDSSKNSKEGSNQGELRHLEALQGSTKQDPCMQGVSETPILGWNTCSLQSKLEDSKGLTEKVGTIGLQSLRKNQSGAAKKRARMAGLLRPLLGTLQWPISAASKQPVTNSAGTQNIWDPEEGKEVKTWTQ